MTSPTTSEHRPRRKGAPKTDRRSELVQIAGRLFAEKGFLATTIRDVAEAAGIQSGSLYHHFTSKESMIEELLGQYWATLLERYRKVVAEQGDVALAARGLVRESVILLDECEYALKVMLTDWTYLASAFPFMVESLKECQDIWLDVLERGKADGVFNPEHDTVIMYRTIMASVSGTARWYDPRGPITVTDLADKMAALFMDGIAARA